MIIYDPSTPVLKSYFIIKHNTGITMLKVYWSPEHPSHEILFYSKKWHKFMEKKHLPGINVSF